MRSYIVFETYLLFKAHSFASLKAGEEELKRFSRLLQVT